MYVLCIMKVVHCKYEILLQYTLTTSFQYTSTRTVYGLLCTAYIVWRTVYGVQCTEYSVLRTVYGVLSTYLIKIYDPDKGNLRLILKPGTDDFCREYV